MRRLREFVESEYFKFFIHLIVFGSTVLLIFENPAYDYFEESGVIQIFYWIISVTFLVEFLIKILVLSVPGYFNRRWNILQFAVVCECLHFIIQITYFMTHGEQLFPDGFQIARVLRVLRVFEYVNYLKLIHSQKLIIKGLRDSIQEFILITNCIMMMLVIYAFVASYLFGPHIRSICLQPNLDAESNYWNYMNDENFLYCGRLNQCPSNYSCVSVQNATTFNIGYINDHDSFFTLFSIATLKDWSFNFWILDNAVGSGVTFLFFTVVAVSVALVAVNIFPAILLVNIKTHVEDYRWISWLSLFKRKYGADVTISQFELLLFSLDSDLEVNKDLHQPFVDSEQQSAQIAHCESYLSKWSIFCVPNCFHGLSIFRDWISSDESLWTKCMIIVVLLDVLALAIHSKNTPDGALTTYNVVSIFFGAIFILEFVVKIISMGPFMYFSHKFYFLDFLVVLCNILELIFWDSEFVYFLRLVRLLRLARLAQMSHLKNMVSGHKTLSDTVLDVIDIFGLMLSSVYPILNAMVPFIIALFIYTLLGYYFFHRFDESENKYAQFSDFDDRMNYGSFFDSLMTTYGSFTMSYWFQIMKKFSSMGEISYIYFVSWMIFSTWFFRSLLRAIVAIIMEHNAENLFIAHARGNELKLLNLFKRQEIIVVRYYFQIYKYNVFGVILDHKNHLSRLSNTSQYQSRLNDMNEKDVIVSNKIASCLKNFNVFISSWSDYNLLLFHKKSTTSVSARWIRDHFVWRSLVYICIVISVLMSILDILRLNDVSKGTGVSSIFFVFFTVDMILKWLESGFLRCFSNPVSLIDLFCNLCLFFEFVFGFPWRLRILRCFRIAKLFDLTVTYLLLAWPRRFEFEGMILQAGLKSLYSLRSAMIVLLFGLILLSIIALQLWMGKTGYCSDETFPGYKNKDDLNSNYPYGCRNVSLESYPYEHVEWNDRVSKYDNIFDAFQTLFRLFMRNDWTDILYYSIDATGIDMNPQKNFNPSAFVFFFIVTLLSIFVSVFFIGVVYYHFLILKKERDSGQLVGIRTVIWTAYEERLRYVEPIKIAEPPGKETSFLRRSLYFLYNSVEYNVFWCLVLAAPLNMLIFGAKYPVVLENLRLVNICVSFAYLCDFVGRMIVTFVFHDSKPKFVVADCLICMFEIIVLGVMLSESTLSYYTFAIVKISAVLRFVKLLIAFPKINSFYFVVMCSVGEFWPMFIAGTMVLILYAVLGMAIIASKRSLYDDDFNAYHYHFRDFKSAVVTLFSYGTENLFEIINSLSNSVHAKDFVPDWLYISLIKLYFYFFFIGSVIFLQLYSLIFFHQYQKFAGGTIGLAPKEIESFQKCWLRLFKYSEAINYRQLEKFVRELNFPLGLKGKFGIISCNLDFRRYMRRMLLAIPRQFDTRSIKDSFIRDPNKYKSLYDETGPNSLPQHLTMFPQDQLFSFGQILIAVHKCAILLKPLSDELIVGLQREKSRKQLAKLKFMIGRQEVRMNPLLTDKEEAMNTLLVLQRIDLKSYQDIIFDILSYEVDALIQKISSNGYCGFLGYCFDKLSVCVASEVKAARLKVSFEKSFRHHRIGRETVQSQQRLENALIHCTRIETVGSKLAKIFETYGQIEWNLDSVQVTNRIMCENIVSLKFDDINTLYVGFKGKIEILHFYTDTKEYELIQEINVDGVVRSLDICSSGPQILAAVDENVIVYIRSQTSQRSKPSFVETYRLQGHKRNIYAVKCVQKYIISCSDDGKCILWRFNSIEPYLECTRTNPIYCFTILLRSEQELILRDHTRNLVFAGTKSGKILALPIPRKSAASGTNEFDYISQAWEDPFTIAAFNGACVSAIELAWGLVYTGSSHGEVKIWSVVDRSKDRRNFKKYIRFCDLIALQMVECKAIHAGPITGITFTGNLMFTCSHDLSIVTWKEPTRLSKESSLGFEQICETGKVLHCNPIICMVSNRSFLASADSNGQIVIQMSGSSKLVSCKMDIDDYEEHPLVFSFTHFNFGSCTLTSITERSIQYETNLTFSNQSGQLQSVRCLYTKTDFLQCEVLPPLDKAIFSEGVDILPNESFSLKFVFTPLEIVEYQMKIPFIISNDSITMIHVSGRGMKPMVRIQNYDLVIDFGCVEVGNTYSKPIEVFNESEISCCVEFCDFFADDQANFIVSGIDNDNSLDDSQIVDEKDRGDNKIKKTNQESKSESARYQFLSQVGLTMTPSIFVLQPLQRFTFDLNFSPASAISSFSLPLRVSYAGVVRSLATVSGRSKLSYVDAKLGKKSSMLSGGCVTNRDFILSKLIGNPAPMLQVALDRLNAQCWSLNNADWSTAVINPVAGMFVEIIDSCRAPSLKIPSLDICDKIEFQLTYTFDTTIEVWYSRQLLATVQGDGNELSKIRLSSNDFNNSENSLFGCFNISIAVKLRKESSANKSLCRTLKKSTNSLSESAEDGSLLCIINCRIFKGIRIPEYFNINGRLLRHELQERIFIVGIESTITILYVENRLNPQTAMGKDINNNRSVKALSDSQMERDEGFRILHGRTINHDITLQAPILNSMDDRSWIGKGEIGFIEQKFVGEPNQNYGTVSSIRICLLPIHGYPNVVIEEFGKRSGQSMSVHELIREFDKNKHSYRKHASHRFDNDELYIMQVYVKNHRRSSGSDRELVITYSNSAEEEGLTQLHMSRRKLSLHDADVLVSSYKVILPMDVVLRALVMDVPMKDLYPHQITSGHFNLSCNYDHIIANKASPDLLFQLDKSLIYAMVDFKSNTNRNQLRSEVGRGHWDFYIRHGVVQLACASGDCFDDDAAELDINKQTFYQRCKRIQFNQKGVHISFNHDISCLVYDNKLPFSNIKNLFNADSFLSSNKHFEKFIYGFTREIVPSKDFQVFHKTNRVFAQQWNDNCTKKLSQHVVQCLLMLVNKSEVAVNSLKDTKIAKVTSLYRYLCESIIGGNHNTHTSPQTFFQNLFMLSSEMNAKIDSRQGKGNVGYPTGTVNHESKLSYSKFYNFLTTYALPKCKGPLSIKQARMIMADIRKRELDEFISLSNFTRWINETNIEDSSNNKSEIFNPDEEGNYLKSLLLKEYFVKIDRDASQIYQEQCHLECHFKKSKKQNTPENIALWRQFSSKFHSGNYSDFMLHEDADTDTSEEEFDHSIKDYEDIKDEIENNRTLWFRMGTLISRGPKLNGESPDQRKSYSLHSPSSFFSLSSFVEDGCDSKGENPSTGSINESNSKILNRISDFIRISSRRSVESSEVIKNQETKVEHREDLEAASSGSEGQYFEHDPFAEIVGLPEVIVE